MIAIQLTNVKDCMSHLLLSDTFDSFLFLEGKIVTYATFSIDGHFHPEFFSPDDLSENEEIPEYSSWKNIREFCFSLIKGRRTPLQLKLIFSLSPANVQRLLTQHDIGLTPADVQGLYLNFRYDGEHLQCITGVSLNLFTMDKSLEQIWDSMVQKFLDRHNISFELIS